jgi:hypothetical protein
MGLYIKIDIDLRQEKNKKEKTTMKKEVKNNENNKFVDGNFNAGAFWCNALNEGKNNTG